MKKLVVIAVTLFVHTAHAAPITFLFGDKDCFGTDDPVCADGAPLHYTLNTQDDAADDINGTFTDLYYFGVNNGSVTRVFDLDWSLSTGTVVNDATVVIRASGIDDTRTTVSIDGVEEASGIAGSGQIGTITISSLFSSDTVSGPGGNFALDTSLLASFEDGIDLSFFQFDTDGISVDYIEVTLNSQSVPAAPAFLVLLAGLGMLAACRRAAY